MAGDAPRSDHPDSDHPDSHERTGDADTMARPGGPPALYRKYRPATFAEVKGQGHVTEPLRQALRSGRIHHAYLFSGPRGCGKTSSARILARSLNCEQGPTPDPCGQCASCVALAPTGPGSIDVIEIDAASHGLVDDARELRERAFYAPVAGRYKVYIIDEAHMVTNAAFNALLKLVEEPPPHLKFVFATTEPEKVIATIRSRTHHYPFRLMPPAVLRELLEEILKAEGVTWEPAVLPLVVRAGAGSARDALSVLDQLIAGADERGLTYERSAALLGYTDDSLLDAVIDAFAAADGAAVFGTLDRVMESGHDPRRFATDLLDRLRDLIILAVVPRAGQSGLLDAPADRLERMAGQAGRFGQAELTRAAAIVSEGLIQMRGTTAPRLILELTCAQVLLPGAHDDEKALLARVERLERHERTASGPPGRGAPALAAKGPGPESTSAPSAEVTSSPARESSAEVASSPARQPAADGRQPPPAETGPRPAPERPGDISTERAAVAGRGPGAGGPHDTDSLRRGWPELLGAVRGQRKVTAMLLQSAAIESLDEGVVTVAFAREGEARGFAAGGHEQVLEQVLSTFLGRPVRVRAVYNPGAPGVGAGQRQGGGPAVGPDSAGRGLEPVRQPADEGGGAHPADDREEARHAGVRGERFPDGPQGRARPAAAGAASGETGPSSGTSGADGARTRADPRPAESRRRAGRGVRDGRTSDAGADSVPGTGRDHRAAGRASQDEWPDDAGELPDGASGRLSGMDLIRHQLGGEVIEEIED
jgi:DNA polymerase-3 subunit gamma/tau